MRWKRDLGTLNGGAMRRPRCFGRRLRMGEIRRRKRRFATGCSRWTLLSRERRRRWRSFRCALAASGGETARLRLWKRNGGRIASASCWQYHRRGRQGNCSRDLLKITIMIRGGRLKERKGEGRAT